MIVALHKAKRPPRLPAGGPHRKALSVEKDMAKTLHKGLVKMRESVPMDELTRALHIARSSDVIKLLEDAGLDIPFEDLEPLLVRGTVEGAKTASRIVALDAERPQLMEWVRSHGAELVRDTTRTSRQAIKSIITSGVDGGRHPARMAKDIRAIVGLDDRSAMAVERRRTMLLEREDMPAERAHAAADRYAEKLLKRRAENIARTESMTCVNAGRAGLWQQLAETGALPSDQLKEWDTSLDDAVCRDLCRPMHGKRIPVGHMWELPDGSKVLSPPSHPGCRCSELLV